ncbi:molybdopterin cofactor-binding domain-containing protein, partial [Komagataeibacter kakiaceti]|uniref:molybdopterin cofactor-binding domain-containing protein n=1 Tax=Komagataeibacter kakiaceti TaxID=943261 RepID=UPI000557DC25
QAAVVLDRPPGTLRPGRGGIHDATRNTRTQPLLTYGDLARQAPDLSALTAEFRGQVPSTPWKSANARYLFCTGAVICQVAIERATGVVTLEKVELHCAAGPVIDVAGYLGQLEGGLMQGMGFTLMEHVPYGQGRPLALNLDGYMVPMMPDTPQALAIHAYEAMDSNDPAGVRGVGELGMAALTPAMANAVAAATGLWPHAAPFRPEQIMRALGTWIEEHRQ